ncbi:mechanosensitive ion channel family protein [Dechloromonas sp. CZR5]|uniref:mechanosensitive ion channel family protein n=1 Tax=Dechloromonas sp. CZR5 TaxID=2608630 RepID=UPI00123C85FC|nr:mechanosensitive ion channel family protein [Dechloromonas sp. CZR5]
MEIDSTSLRNVFEQFALPLRVTLILMLTLVAQHLINRLAPRFREALASRQESAAGAQRVRTLSRVLRYTLTVVLTVVSALLILGEFGISVAPLLGAAGVAGIAVGFGAQSLVKDYFTGFFLLLENQIRIGDVIDAGGKVGAVEELTLRYLRLRDYGGNVHYIPNGQITVVTNMSVGFAYAVIDLGVAYGEDTDQVVEVIEEVGRQMRGDASLGPRILGDLEIAGIDQWADSSVIIRCRFQVTPNEQWSIRREFLRRAKQAFDRQGIEIPFPHIKLVAEVPA